MGLAPAPALLPFGILLAVVWRLFWVSLFWVTAYVLMFLVYMFTADVWFPCDTGGIAMGQFVTRAGYAFFSTFVLSRYLFRPWFDLIFNKEKLIC